MIAACPKPLDEARAIALESLARFGADTARIIDTAKSASVVAIVRAKAP